MRVVFIGASEAAIMATETLLENGHEVVIIETNQDKIEQLSETLDCSLLQGDGGNPAVLREVEPEQTDILFCIANDDKSNLIASLVGRSLGFRRVVTSIEDPAFEKVCRDLGLDDTIIPAKTLSTHLENMVEGLDSVELSTVLKDEARLFTFIAGASDTTTVAELGLPEDARVICYYRQGKFTFADQQTRLKKDDEVVILTRSGTLAQLQERWDPRQAGDEQGRG